MERSLQAVVRTAAGAVAAAGMLALGGCSPPAAQIHYDGLAAFRVSPPRPGGSTRADLTADEASLAEQARLETIVRIALARNPGLGEAEARTRSDVGQARAAGRLPDLELKVEQWGVPLRRPYALADADALMVGVRQGFPAPGARGAEARAAAEQAQVTAYALRARRLDLVRQVERGYAEYVLADRESRIHLEHAELTGRILDTARAGFRSGGVSQQDVLRVSVELEALHRDIAQIAQRRRSAAAMLNSLMGRDASAPLGPAPDLEAAELDLALPEMERLAAARRPERRAAAHAIRRSQASADAARSTARWPSLMIGVDYMYMPASDEEHGYGAMLSINLPWLNPRSGEHTRAREQMVEADRRAAESVDLTVRYEVIDALARHEAARRTYLISRDQLVPAARRSFEAGQAGLATGRGSTLGLLDALQSLLEARLGETRALAELRTSLADLERAVGTDLRRGGDR